MGFSGTDKVCPVETSESPIKAAISPASIDFTSFLLSACIRIILESLSNLFELTFKTLSP